MFLLQFSIFYKDTILTVRSFLKISHRKANPDGRTSDGYHHPAVHIKYLSVDIGRGIRGQKDKVTELEPVFICMGKKVVYCGEAGQGSSMKMAVNLLLGIMAAAISEAVNLG
jgi:hypothetical protein